MTTPEVGGEGLASSKETEMIISSPALDNEEQERKDGKKRNDPALEEFEPISPGHVQDIMDMEENAQFKAGVGKRSCENRDQRLSGQ